MDMLEYLPSQIKEIYINKDLQKNKNDSLIKIAQKNRIRITTLGKTDLDKKTGKSNHQGIAADINDFQYEDYGSLLNTNHRFYLILDHIEDPHNLGAIIRTANFFGVGGIIIPKDRAVGVTPTVIKTSSGAAMTIPICRVSNIGNAINDLKKNNVWIVGADISADKEVSEIDIENLDIALVIGSEGKGLTKSIKNQCDFLVSITKTGKVESLNASVAAGILMYKLSE